MNWIERLLDVTRDWVRARGLDRKGEASAALMDFDEFLWSGSFETASRGRLC